MPQRFLRPGITTSDLWNACSFPAQSLFVRLLTLVDDYGRFDGRASVIHGYCFSLRPEMKTEKVRALIDELCQNGLVQLYMVDDKEFIRILKWSERARGASKYPAPPDEDNEGEPSGTIYFVQAGDTKRIKIGFTQWTAEQRLRRLQVGSPEKLKLLAAVTGTVREERALHRQFASDNTGGEWFVLSKEIVDYLASPEVRRKCVQPAGEPHEKMLPSPLVISHESSPSPVHPRHSTNGSQVNTSAPTDEVWLRELAESTAYQGIDVPREYAKMEVWCKNTQKKPSRRRFINWLNRCEKPMVIASGQRPKPPKDTRDIPDQMRAYLIEGKYADRDVIATWKVMGDVPEAYRGSWYAHLKKKGQDRAA